MSKSDRVARRDVLRAAGLSAVGAALPAGFAYPRPPAEANLVGRPDVVRGLDGMSRAADPGSNPFGTGHCAAAVISAAFFCQEQRLGAEAQRGIRAVLDARLLTNPIFAPRPEEKADPDLVAGLVQDLDAGIDRLRSSGHNIIFAAVALNALRDVPEAATPARVRGLRATVRSFGAGGRPAPPAARADGLVGLDDEAAFVRFVLEEYLKALDLYRRGRGHHGFAGHVLTVGHALVVLARMGHGEVAAKGVGAYWEFIRQARAGADLGGRPVADGPPRPPTPLAGEYWAGRAERRTGEIVSSHLIKYPYSFYALAAGLRDEAFRQRLVESVYHLTAQS
jgi:hypothetical protein